MNGECNATNVQGKNYNLHKLQGGHVPQCPIAGDATDNVPRSYMPVHYTNDHALRGHDLKLYKQYNRLNIRKHFFSQRVTDAWNQLPSSVVDAASINSFKRNLKDMGIKS